MYILYKGVRHEVHIDVRSISNQLSVFLTYAMTPNLLTFQRREARPGPALSNNGEGKVGARRGRGNEGQ